MGPLVSSFRFHLLKNPKMSNRIRRRVRCRIDFVVLSKYVKQNTLMAAQQKKQRLRLEEVYIIFKNVYLYILQLPKVGLVSGQRRRCSRISVYIQVSMTTTRTCMSYRLGGFDSSKLICASNRQSSQKWSIENS